MCAAAAPTAAACLAVILMLGTLERRVEAISGEFRSQDIANTLRTFQMAIKPGEGIMRQLERRAEATSVDFISHDVANTMWAFATTGTKPGEAMMGQLERRAEATSGEFNSQDVSISLRALATMRTKPVEGMMGQWWSEMMSGEFNSKDIANTLRAYETIGKNPGEVVNTGGMLDKASAQQVEVEPKEAHTGVLFATSSTRRSSSKIPNIVTESQSTQTAGRCDRAQIPHLDH
jgi:hypothetical protein